MTRIVCEKCDVMFAPELVYCPTCTDNAKKARKSKKVEKVESKTITISSGSLSR